MRKRKMVRFKSRVRYGIGLEGEVQFIKAV